MISCRCKKIINVLTMMMALLRAGRKCPGFHCIDYSSPEAVLKKLKSDDRDRDLVVSFGFMNGSENSLIVDTTGYYNIWSRSSSKLIKVFPNLFLDMLLIYERVLKNYHNCDELMALPEEHLLSKMTNFSILTMLGES